jgi:hypothetical protein
MKQLFALLLLAGSAHASGSAFNYCQATLNSANTAASIGYTGSLTLADGTFALTVIGHPEVPTSFGMFVSGDQQYNVPFGNGYLCVMPFSSGILRMTPQPLLPGMLVKDIAAEPQEFVTFVPGQSTNFQFWYRDPAAGGSKFNLSDALHVDFGL